MSRPPLRRIGVAQLRSTEDFDDNLSVIRELCRRAKKSGAHWVALPENCLFLGLEGAAAKHAEELEASRFVGALCELAKDEQLTIFAGSVPERSIGSDTQGRAYNTSVVIGVDGEVLADYRKIHLFDVELPDGRAIRESDGWIAGESEAVVSVDGWRVGLSICYDLRFPEHYRRLVDDGAHVLMVPSAFTLQTGKDHWLPLLTSRAIENQCYVVAAAQWGEHFPGRVSWGKSMAIDPWGTVLATAPERPSVVVAELDFESLARVRDRFPSLRHRRHRA